MPTLLIVDDERNLLDTLCRCFHRAFRATPVTLVTAESAGAALEAFTRHTPDAVILDIGLPDMSGLDLFRQIHQRDARIPVIFMTGGGTTETAIEAMKLGAYEYVLKPVQFERLQDLVARALAISRAMRVPTVVAQSAPAGSGSDVILGRCPAMQEVYKAIGRVAPRDVTVLIQGESGTGKELVARAIYQHSLRASGAFLAINCAAIPEPLLESELFGHEKGAFTGADRSRIGKFEQCSGGTLFLDEIGDMTPLTQTKILRVLQEQRFERVGGSETIQTDVRLIAATHRELERLVAAGEFRGDLFYRLNVFPIRLPPLRERREDFPLLVDYFVRQFAQELHKPVETTAPETMRLLEAHSWPGNLRELQSVLKQAILHATGPLLIADFLPEHIRTPRAMEPAAPAASDDVTPLWGKFISERLQRGCTHLYDESLELMERHLITEVLRHTGGNQLRAAATLGITRGCLRNKIRSLGITLECSVSAG